MALSICVSGHLVITQAQKDIVNYHKIKLDLEEKQNYLMLGKVSHNVEMQYKKSRFFVNTGKSVSEAFILESVNPQYDERLFIEFP